MRHAKRQHATVAGGGFNAAGKVVLAAIVHHDTIQADNLGPSPHESCQENGAQESQTATPKKGNKKAGGKQKQTSNTHEDDKSFSIGKLSKLFSKKKHTTESPKPQPATTLIDRAKSNEYLASNEEANAAKFGNSNAQNELVSSPLNQQFHSSDHPDQVVDCSRGKTPGRDEQVIEFKFDLIVDQPTPAVISHNSGSDFISGATNQMLTTSGSCDRRKAGEQKSGEQVEADIMRLKLSDNIDELVESFVLDSNDVCLMSIGEQQVDLNIRYHSQEKQQQRQQLDCPKAEEFEYLSQLSLHTLAYSFHLLGSAAQRRPAASGRATNNGSGSANGHHQQSSSSSPSSDVELMSLECASQRASSGSGRPGRQEPPRREPTSSTAASNYSIELSATLFLCSEQANDEIGQPTAKGVSAKPISAMDTRAAHNHPTCESAPPTHQQLSGCFSIIDLLANCRLAGRVSPRDSGRCYGGGDDDDDDDGDVVGDSEDEPARRTLTNGSSSASVASTVDCSTVEEALDTIGRVRRELSRLGGDGRLQTQKKTLIISLKLKQRINGGLFSNRMCLIDFRPKFFELQPIFESIFNGQALAHLKRQKFHLQSLRELSNSSIRSSDDEHLLSKQHHQVASQDKLIQAEWLLYKQLSSALIRTLLIVHVHKLVSPVSHEKITHKTTNDSNFSLSQPNITPPQQKLITGIEHRLMGENLLLLEFARSIQRASCVRLKRRKRHLRSHLASSNVSVASNISATTTTNELLSSPLDHKLHHRHLSPVARPLADERAVFNTSSSHRKASLDMNLALSRHHHRHNHHRSHHYSHQQRSHHSSRYLPTYTRCYTLQRRSDLTESSSVSTSSGSGRHHRAAPPPQHRSARPSRSAALNRSYSQQRNNCCSNNPLSLNNLSDSDSVTSANLNSCSSSSYSRLPTNWSARQRGVELKWLTKQSQMISKNRQIDPSSGSSPIELSSSSRHFQTTAGQRSSSMSRNQVTRERSRGAAEETSLMASRASSVIQIDCHPASRRRASDLLSSGQQESGAAAAVNHRSLLMQMADESTTVAEATAETIDDINDNASDICSVVAEPPKQLKLEEFLNQLSSIISPITTNSLGKPKPERSSAGGGQRRSQVSVSGRKEITSTTADEVTNDIMCLDGYDSDGVSRVGGRKQEYCLTGSGQQQQRHRFLTAIRNSGNGAAEEDDEDCKSHSSILEHLSSLAQESNTKLNNRQQQLQQQRHHLDYQFQGENNRGSFEADHQQQHQEVILGSSPNGYRHTFLLNNSESPDSNASADSHEKNPTGHLQRLLNSSTHISGRRTTSSRVTVRDPTYTVEDQLRALSISCQASAVGSTSPSASSGAFVSSNESSCSPSSAQMASSSATFEDRMMMNSKMKPGSAQQGPAANLTMPQQPQRDLYARNPHHLNVKT